MEDTIYSLEYTVQSGMGYALSLSLGERVHRKAV
jgi:hypothetical protein